MRFHGLGCEMDLDEIEPARRATSADGTRVVAWYVSRHAEDRFDDDTHYAIVVFDAATKARVASFARSHCVRNDTRETQGKPVASVGFRGGDRDAVAIRFEDGTEEVERVAAAGERAEPPEDIEMPEAWKKLRGL